MATKGVLSKELSGLNIVPAKANKDERRVNMYRDYISRELPIPFHLADNEAELNKYSMEAIYAPREEVDNTIDDDVLDSLDSIN